MKLKVVLIFLALFMTQFSYSQMRGGGQGMGGGQGKGGQGRGGQRPGGGKPGGQSLDISKINFEESAGIIHYDIDEVFDKIKLKDKVIKSKVEKVFLSYENDLKQLNVSHPKNMKFFKESLDLLKGYMERREVQNVKGLMQESKKHIFVISPVAKKIRDGLNSTLQGILNEKEMKRWTKYMSSKTEKVFNVGNTTMSK